MPVRMRAFGLLLLAALTAAACRRAERPIAVKRPTGTPQGSLPAGCAIVATLDRAAFAQLGEAANALLAASGGQATSLAGIDLRRDVRSIRYCKPGPTAGGPSKPQSFIALMSGEIPANAIVAAAGSPKTRGTLQDLEGVPVLATERVWIARRGPGHTAGELVMASDRDLLHAALFDPPEQYGANPGSPLSIFVAPTGLGSLLRTPAGPGPSPLAAVRELRIDLVRGATAVTAHFVVGDDDKARSLAKALAEPLEGLARPLAGGTAPKVAIDVSAGDVLATVDLPPGTIEALAARLGPRGRARPPLTSR